MRTTLTIDDDLLKKLKERSRKQGVPLKQVLNHTLRIGLERSGVLGSKKPYKCRTFSMGYPPLYNLDKALLVADAGLVVPAHIGLAEILDVAFLVETQPGNGGDSVQRALGLLTTLRALPRFESHGGIAPA